MWGDILICATVEAAYPVAVVKIKTFAMASSPSGK
jgi:hypothetical protein